MSGDAAAATVEIVDPDEPDTDEAFVVPLNLQELPEETMTPPDPVSPPRRPDEEPSLATLFREELEAGRRSRERLTDVIEKNEAAQVARHGEMMSELRGLRQDLAVEAAADGAVKQKAVSVLVGAWQLFRGPLATLATAAGAYAAWRLFGLPPTPTPVSVSPVAVEVTAAPPAPAPAPESSPLRGDGP